MTLTANINTMTCTEYCVAASCNSCNNPPARDSKLYCLHQRLHKVVIARSLILQKSRYLVSAYTFNAHRPRDLNSCGELLGRSTNSKKVFSSKLEAGPWLKWAWWLQGKYSTTIRGALAARSLEERIPKCQRKERFDERDEEHRSFRWSICIIVVLKNVDDFKELSFTSCKHAFGADIYIMIKTLESSDKKRRWFIVISCRLRKTGSEVIPYAVSPVCIKNQFVAESMALSMGKDDLAKKLRWFLEHGWYL